MRKRWRNIFQEVTITIIPHRGNKLFEIKFSFLGLWLVMFLFIFTYLATFILALKISDYFELKQELKKTQAGLLAWQKKYNQDVGCLKETLAQLRETEYKLRELLKLGSKEEIIKQAEIESLMPYSGAVDIDAIKHEIEKRLESLSELKKYLKTQKSIYLATPLSWPTLGYISSRFGWRIHPITGKKDFHGGVDISAPAGTPVRSTANGVVVYAGRTKFNGNFVIIEHGYGYTTLYAHLKKYIVRVGQKVKRGDIIGYVGSTGLATGPHLHYEIWKNKRRVNPLPYIKKRYFSKKK
ncbi:MAG: peptidoglycan DD-metalloendopeptidase family protein [Candidatus Desulfofervidus auxilii]|nr:peptidoglycan DD-metalloendopeptidase family protein [Candidatus Desulfofervidus auxilii]